MTTDATPDLKARPAGERILLAAHDLFYREGIRATGIDRVIAESGVTKVTFYRHFPSKNDLILAFLAYRHERWMAWFADALQRHGGSSGKGIAALVPALREWFGQAGYRGCAFLNSVGELGGSLPEVVAIARSHKRGMEQAIAGLLPPSRQRARDAQAIALAVDGAIVHSQFEETPDAALKSLARLVDALQPEAALKPGRTAR
ncbi:TetR/AcrR family transcriptional regulator [Variovorax sp. J22R24]|uniref:TetR/AcrR family transcriptional regulator n=1 Tax=Variovorax gracilis TaxID=3053502 RepID=UPI002574C8B2|nr:TetR/AcrR family transcriptional regulator [Variovorax sp. J22R24]MDM0107916.1 TetR/AcrR family transcriptional regulator [Variovorax sp. J22R24]